MSSENYYVIDTSSLINLNRHNPIDVYPSVWKSVESLIQRGLLVAPKEVFKEIAKQDDMLLKWAKDNKGLFKGPTQLQLKIVKEILEKYPSIVKVGRENDADVFVIALAIEMSRDKQKQLVPVKRIVVTEERLRGDKIRIPLICRDYNIDCIDVIEMFRTEKIKF